MLEGLNRGYIDFGWGYITPLAVPPTSPLVPPHNQVVIG